MRVMVMTHTYHWAQVKKWDVEGVQDGDTQDDKIKDVPSHLQPGQQQNYTGFYSNNESSLVIIAPQLS